MGKFKCPHCGETNNLKTERRPDGYTTCLTCEFKALTSLFVMSELELIKTKLNTIDIDKLQEALDELNNFGERGYGVRYETIQQVIDILKEIKQ